MSKISATRSAMLDLTSDVECCISRVMALGLMAEGLLKVDRRLGNAFAMVANDVEEDLVRILSQLEGRAEA